MKRNIRESGNGGDEDRTPLGVGPTALGNRRDPERRGEGAWEDPGAKFAGEGTEERDLLDRDPRERAVTREELDEIGESGDRDPLLQGEGTRRTPGDVTGYEGDSDSEFNAGARVRPGAREGESNP